jgi:hypothetical protein
MNLPSVNLITDIHYVFPAGSAGIQKPRMASSKHILETWISAVDAGMTCYLNRYK